jgi:uncharacterized protein YkwD
MMQQDASTPALNPVARRFARRLSNLLAGAALAAAGAVPTGMIAAVPAHAAVSFDAAGAEAQLLGELNTDRAQNGLGPVVLNTTLGNIARNAPHNVCGTGTLHGRSQDMIERGYFSHQVPPCSAYAWPILSSYGVQYSSAGENIGWNNYAPQSTSVDQVNTAFMNSPGHRANILGAYNQVGIGAYMAPGNWSYGGQTYTGVIMYTEIFIQGPVPAPQYPSAASVDPIGALGTDNQLWARQGTGAYQPLGGVLMAAPAVVRASVVPGGVLYVGTGADHDLWIRSTQLGWQRLNAGGPVYCIDNPAVTIIGSTLHASCQGGDRQLWYATGNVVSGGLPSVGGWQPLGGVLASGPGTGQLPGAGGPTFLVEGTDGAVWSRDQGSGWRSTGWRCVGHPALAATGTGTAYFACHGSDGQLWVASNSGAGWNTVRPIGGAPADGVGASIVTGGVHVYYQGPDGAVYQDSLVNGATGGILLVGGGVKNGVGAAA